MNYKILVNKVYPYNKEMFNNVILKKIINDIGEEYLLEKRTLKAYFDLKKDLEKDNIKIVINSGYRSIEDQIDTKNKYLSIYGLDYTNKYVAEPGSSEHHTGLCFDIGIMIDNKVVDEYDDLKPYMDMFETIMTKLKDYGLILRYPKGKEKITGYNYEPWHYRYVGKSTANIITDNNLTLEEYNELYNKSGVLLVNKPKGLTSRDVVNRLEKVFDTKKVGHNGTLDPMAEGLLVITINKATKINELLAKKTAEYIRRNYPNSKIKCFQGKGHCEDSLLNPSVMIAELDNALGIRKTNNIQTNYSQPQRIKSDESQEINEIGTSIEQDEIER